MSALKNKIEYYLSQERISVSEFERRAGLKQSAVRNILYGKSKTPSLSTARGIACEIGVTVDSLLSEKDESEEYVDLKVFAQTLSHLSAYLDKSSDEYKMADLLSAIKNSYQYYKKSGNVDLSFIDWLLSKRK